MFHSGIHHGTQGPVRVEVGSADAELLELPGSPRPGRPARHGIYRAAVPGASRWATSVAQ